MFTLFSSVITLEIGITIVTKNSRKLSFQVLDILVHYEYVDRIYIYDKQCVSTTWFSYNNIVKYFREFLNGVYPSCHREQ